MEKRFNARFFTAADSREPELAGVWGAAVGSFWTLFVCLAISIPVGVLAAIWLEEFAPRNRWTDLIEVNINNLAGGCRRSCSACSGCRCSSASSGCPVRRRWWAALCWR